MAQARISADRRLAVHAAPDTGMQCCLLCFVWRPSAGQPLQQAECSAIANWQAAFLLHGARMAIPLR